MTIERTQQGDQIVLPGAERSAHQAAAAREKEAHGKMRAKRVQLGPGGMFAIETPQPDLFT